MTITTIKLDNRNNIVDASSDLKFGQLVKVKGDSRPADRSPYMVFGGLDVQGNPLVSPLDTPANGNRKARRARWRQQQRPKKS